MKKSLTNLIALLLVCGVVTGCKDKAPATQPVKGTIEQQIAPDSVPQEVSLKLKNTQKASTDDCYEAIMGDKDSMVSVWGLMKCSDNQSSQGYGVVVVKDGQETAFEIRHGNMPKAFYDEETGLLWFSGAVMEGTGTLVERPYLIKFDENKRAEIITSIDPYDMQQELVKKISYSIEGQDVTFYVDGELLTTVTNHTQDMGAFYDDPIWIGEQIEYQVGKKLTVCFVPGISFVTGKVLIYDDMPSIAATVELTDDGFSLSDFRIVD